jgi:tRNA G18 (ribose-2'-O)-methylase SpoU
LRTWKAETVIVRVNHAGDPRLDDYRQLADRSARRRAGLFVGEQALVVERMLALPGVTKSVLVAERRLGRIAHLAPPELPVYAAPTDVLRLVAGFDVHRGVLAVGYRAPFEGRRILDLVPPAPAPVCVLACEGITNIDNIGLLFRNAAAFGAAAVLLDHTSHDPLYRKSLRVSIGYALTLAWARAGDWPGDLEALRRERGLVVVGASLSPGAIPLDDLEPPARSALLVGTEATGLSPSALAACDVLVRIPMAPGVDSLNVAVAAAVCLYRLTAGRVAVRPGAARY